MLTLVDHPQTLPEFLPAFSSRLQNTLELELPKPSPASLERQDKSPNSTHATQTPLNRCETLPGAECECMAWGIAWALRASDNPRLQSDEHEVIHPITTISQPIGAITTSGSWLDVDRLTARPRHITNPVAQHQFSRFCSVRSLLGHWSIK